MYDCLKVLVPDDFRQSTAVYGIYILRSRHSTGVFRIGACGINDKGTIGGRFRTHRGKQLPDNKLWTNRHKPWDPIWCASITNGTRSLTGLAERLLYLAMARNFQIVDVSGFEASPKDEPRILSLADAAAQEINSFISQVRALPQIGTKEV